MTEGFTYLILLSKPDQYHVGICNATGQDFVPYLNEDISKWLDENMEQNKNYVFESNMNPYELAPETEEVGIAFADESDAVAFKLRWM